MEYFIIFGIGKMGKIYVEKCVSAGIRNIRLSDFNDKLWGTEYCGIKIERPEEVLGDKYRFIIISTGLKYFEEIKKQLIDQYNVDDTLIIHCNETYVLSNNKTYNLGTIKLKDRLNESTIVNGAKLYELIEKEELNDLETFFLKEKHCIISKWLHYFEAYDRFFSKYRNRDVTILEIGVYRGGSLQMWKNYFQTSGNKVSIYGIDIDPKCKQFEEDNIKILIGSQEDRNFLRQVKEQIGKVDILIDDGGHTMNQQIVTLEELFDLVDDEGIYLCEDLHTSYMKEYGGEYKGETFIEYSKKLIDVLHSQYMPAGQMKSTAYTGRIKAVSYYDSMVFIEKMKYATESISLEVKR